MGVVAAWSRYANTTCKRTGVLRPEEYGEAIADVYDDWYPDVSDVEGTVEAVARLAAGRRVLELGIGTGRLALPLRAAGVDVHGVDASAAMVERLRAKPGGADIPVLVADFAERLPPGPFGVVFAAFNTLLNLTEPGSVERCLSLVREHLEPDGCLLVEAFAPADDAPASGVDVRRVDAGEVVLSVFRREPGTDVVHGSLVSLTEAGGVRLRPWSIRTLDAGALDALAASAGFSVEARHGGWRGEPYDDESDRHVVRYRMAAVPSRE
jgi:SAM-dependent methyltransferase